MGHTEGEPAVHAICGVVCAGKTTLAKELASNVHAIDEGDVRFFATIFEPPRADEGLAIDHVRARDLPPTAEG